MGKVVLFGELMLRLKSPGKERFFQNPLLEAVFGGSEANVAVSLANFGQETLFVSAFPDNAVGHAAVAGLRHYGVTVAPLYKEGRLGIYFLEDGACQRPSQVIYDRDGSCFSLAKPEEYDWKNIFSGAEWFHLSGITPAVTQSSADCAFAAVTEAKKQGLTVSLDLNFRKKLWKYGKSASEVMRKLTEKADVLIANEEDIQKCLGIPLKNYNTTQESYRHLCEEVKSVFPDLKFISITLRHSYSADRNGWSAVLLGQKGFYESAYYDIENIVERVGAGDSFAAALIYGLEKYKSEKNGEYMALDFACAASCLKHSIPGDFNLVTVSEVEALMKGNTNGRIQR